MPEPGTVEKPPYFANKSNCLRWQNQKNVSGIIPQAGWASAPVRQSECGKRACVSGHVSEQLFQLQCSEPESVGIMGKRVGRLDFPPK